MKRGTCLTIGVIAFSVLAAQATGAPKRPAAKKPPPKQEVTDPALLPPMSTFITYDVGTLKMTGKTAADVIYSVGPLTFIGGATRPASYSVGTLSMTGKHEP